MRGQPPGRSKQRPYGGGVELAISDWRRIKFLSAGEPRESIRFAQNDGASRLFATCPQNREDTR